MSHVKFSALHEAKSVARNPYAWPGGYQRYLVMADGGALCPACVRKEYRLISQSAICNHNDGWKPAGADINYEDLELRCDNCGAEIPAAYAGGADDFPATHATAFLSRDTGG